MTANTPQYSPPPSFISRLAVKARAKGIYHHNSVVEEYLPKGFVRKGNKTLLMLAGYSYLGLIKDREIAEEAFRASFEKFGIGAHGTAGNCGRTALHSQLEHRLAQMSRSADCMLFPSGYQSNVSTIGALLTPRDVIFSDHLNHASILDGIAASGARIITYLHNDMADLEQKLAQRGDHNALIVSDSVFSMDGDIADIPKLIELKVRFGALLMIDEAHSFGVLGENGFGIAQHFDLPFGSVDLISGVLSKAIPGTGGYVCGSAELIDYLRNNAKSHIYSGSLSPFQVGVALACLDRMESSDDMMVRLRSAKMHFHAALKSHGLDIGPTVTPITPVMIGDSQAALMVADQCVRDGVFIMAIPFPVVPFGKSRLRATVTADHDHHSLSGAAEVIARAVAKHVRPKGRVAEMA